MTGYKLVSIDFPELLNGNNRIHKGTGDHGFVVDVDNFIVPSTVTPKKGINDPLEFAFEGFGIVVFCLIIESRDAPNWYGCAFRANLDRFEDVNIFFHPFPKWDPAKHVFEFPPEEYYARTPTWSRIFRYVQRLGSQLYRESSSQVLLVPIFNKDSYPTTGIFGPNWQDIVGQVLQIASRHPKAADSVGSPVLKRVVLSTYSYGRTLMYTFGRVAPGLKDFIREVWDFDGKQAPPPHSFMGARCLLYDESKYLANSPGVFHTPSRRWLKFTKVDQGTVHAHMPMLFRHAATITNVR